MAKKKTNTPRKRKRLKANPKRQAHAQLRGYLYQIWHSVNAWLDLADNDILYLEGAEDFDTISDDTATATQVKHTQRNITLKSQETADAINNFWKLRTNNRDQRVKFRFLTRSEIGAEQGSPFGKGKRGLEVWKHCSSDEASIIKISEFLQTQERISDEVKTFLGQADPQTIYEQLIKSITWETNSKPISYVEQSIRKKLVYHGNRYSIPYADAQKVVDHLLKEALTVAAREENRELTRDHFLKIFAENTRVSLPIQNTKAHQPIELKAVLDYIKEALIADSPDINIAIQSPILDTIPPLYPDVTHRTDLLTNIHAKLQSESIVIIHGGVDTGKTTLVKLIANDLDSDWFWLKFTNKDASQIVRDLQQLDIAISNRSSQVNVVLDDLNLQPPDLQAYEEDLGVVVYRVLERGAKLLITSQHKPPNNFIRSLGLSSPVVVHVPNFTIPEIEQFARQLGCPPEKAKTWAKLFQLPTRRHPRLVHALLTQLRKNGWKRQDVIESILQTPPELAKELEEAQQLLTDLPEAQQEFLYRLSLVCTEFRKDYALNIGGIPESIPYPGRVFDQLVDPWMDHVDKTYYTLSPLLNSAAEQVWSESKINNLHAQVADAILKANDLTTTEARAILLHSIRGQNREGLIAVIGALMTAPEDNWEKLSQEFSWLTHLKTNPPEELFPGDAFVNQLFRSFQYRIAVEVKPEFAPNILEMWNKENKPHEPHQSYLFSRLMLALQVLIHHPVPLPVKETVDYLKEVIEITNNDEQVQKINANFMEQLGEHKTNASNFFSILFSFIYTRNPFHASFLSDLIDTLDELQSNIRTLLLADLKEDSIDCQILINSVWLSETNLENPNWTRCLQVFDKVIEKTIAWGYPYIAAASARGKAIIHDEKLNDPDTAHQVLQDISLRIGVLPSVEEEQALIYLHQKRYKDALNIYERLLPEWNPPSEQLNIGPLEEYRRAAICAASLGDWKKAAIFFEDGAKRTQKIENTERYIGLYADTGFAHFKGGNILNSIKLMSLVLQKFETLPENNTDIKYLTLKKRLVYTIGWMSVHGDENYPSELAEPPIGFCSDPETSENILTSPDFPIGFAWLNLALIEYKFGHGSVILEQILQSLDRNTHPALNYFLSAFELQHDFRNKTFDDLPQRIHQLMNARNSMQEHKESDNGIGELRINSIPISDLPNLDSVEHIIVILVASVLVQLPIGVDIHETLSIWRTNSSELPIKENIFTALDLIEATLSGDQNDALTVMKTQEAKGEKRLVAALKVVQNKETSPRDLHYAHTFITTSLIGKTWEGFVVTDLAELLSAQWLEKIMEIPIRAVSQVEQACKSNKTGKKKIGRILLAASESVSFKVAPGDLQQFRIWADSPQESD